MQEQSKKILDMLAEGKITVDEAAKLLDALKEAEKPIDAPPALAVMKPKPQWLIINIIEGGQMKMEMRIPLKLIRAGVKLGAMMPPEVLKKMGEQNVPFDLNNIKPENIEELIDGLGEMTINMVDGSDGVRMYCE